MKRIFLLGGYDLEMETILDLLDSYSETYFDKHLSWNTALLTYYQEELNKYGNNNDYIIYGIELRSSEGEEIVSNYKLMDHHNEYSDQPSVLIQVAELLGHSLTRYEQLVAANDSAYIPGMIALKATQEEIETIRYKDRRTQGVTDKDEELAIKSLKEKEIIGDWIFVYSYTERFSPITDRLYPYKNLFIYTDTEWMYYGGSTLQVIDLFNSLPNKGSLFYGGGKSGFVGVAKDIYTREEIEQMKEQLIRVI